MYIIRSYILKENSIGIFRVGVDFDLFYCRRYLKKVCFLGLVDGTLTCYVFLFSAILCCLVLFTVMIIIV